MIASVSRLFARFSRQTRKRSFEKVTTVPIERTTERNDGITVAVATTMPSKPSPTRAQFWGGERDGEWLAVDEPLADRGKFKQTVLQSTSDEGDVLYVDEVYALRYSTPRQQWYLIWRGYENTGESEPAEQKPA